MPKSAVKDKKEMNMMESPEMQQHIQEMAKVH